MRAAAPRLMKTASPLRQGGTSGGFRAVTDNLVVVDPQDPPRRFAPPLLRGIFREPTHATGRYQQG